MKFRNGLSRGFVRTFWGVLALASTATAGTVTLKTVNAFDKPACAALRKIVISAGVAQMTRKDLCDFRFARLDPSKTDGFVFPEWTELAVADPVAQFRAMSLGNNPPGETYLGSPRPDILESVSINSRSKNLAFYTTRVQIEGKGDEETLLMADIKSCHGGEINNDMGAPAVFAFNDRALTKQEPMQPASFALGGAQVALWKGHIPIALTISSDWTKIGSWGESLVVGMVGWNRASDDAGPEYINAYTVCTFTLQRRT
jgi:hypothetical protein